MSKLYWGLVFCRTDLEHPAHGPLCVHAKVRPQWYWWLRNLWLFVRIVWRRYDVFRLDWMIAWKVSKVATGLGPCEVHRAKDGTMDEWLRGARPDWARLRQGPGGQAR